MLYRVTGYFRDSIVSKIFTNKYDAIEFKDIVDAHYPIKVTFEKGVYPMRGFILSSWNAIMDHNKNPLRHINDMQTRHIVMQILAWMWCIIFSMSIGSVTVFGISALAHTLLIAGIVITVATFETAKRNPKVFSRYTYGSTYGGRGFGGEHE